MQHRSTTLIASLLLSIAGLSAPRAVQAQSAGAVPAPATRAVRLASLSQKRVHHWAAARPTIRCAAAPLTERPMASAEFARPRVVPLEAAFLDAAIVKRTFAGRVGRLPGSN
jgi:hypothetical protein